MTSDGDDLDHVLPQGERAKQVIPALSGPHPLLAFIPPALLLVWMGPHGAMFGIVVSTMALVILNRKAWLIVEGTTSIVLAEASYWRRRRVKQDGRRIVLPRTVELRAGSSHGAIYTRLMVSGLPIWVANRHAGHLRDVDARRPADRPAAPRRAARQQSLEITQNLPLDRH